MRSFTTALLLAAASLASVSTTAIAQATNDIDVIESRQLSRERRAEQRSERAPEQRPQVQVQQEPQQERRVFQPRVERQSNVEVRQDRGNFERRTNREQNGVEVRRDGGFFNRRNDQQQGNVEVRRDNPRFDRRQSSDVTRVPPQSDVVATPQNNRNDGRRFDGRRFEQRDGQRFGRNEEYRSDRDNSRRFDRDDYRRRGEVSRDKNWYRDGGGKWQRRDGRNYGNRDNRDYGYNGGNKDFRWNRDWRRDSRYDWKSYRFSNRNSFRQSRYYDPFGSRYGYQRFSIGIRIGSGYYNDRYWISDPFAYRLPYADGPYRWVRYYDDVLLIDLRNGAVVDVIHDFFW
jgi:Nickel/cobalt transporter regulator